MKHQINSNWDDNLYWERNFYRYIELYCERFCESQSIQRPKEEFSCNIDVDTERTIEYVELEYVCKYNDKECTINKVDIALIVEGEESEVQYLSQCPCKWVLNKKVSELKLVSTKSLNFECMSINVVYQEEYFKLEPGEKFQLPPNPTEISMITFEAKTSPGNISVIAVLETGSFIQRNFLKETPTMVIVTFFPKSVEGLQLMNTGNSVIFYRNLTTE